MQGTGGGGGGGGRNGRLEAGIVLPYKPAKWAIEKIMWMGGTKI